MGIVQRFRACVIRVCLPAAKSRIFSVIHVVYTAAVSANVFLIVRIKFLGEVLLMIIAVSELADRVDRLRDLGVEFVFASFDNDKPLLKFEQFPECVHDTGVVVQCFQPDVVPMLFDDDFSEILPY